jgi:hypothetical protein
MQLFNRQRAKRAERARLAAEFGVDAVYLIDEPLWYLRAVGRFHHNWKREVAFELGLLMVGLALGFVLGRL